MQITSDEALSALKDVDTAAARTIEARSYEVGSAYLIMWGLLWIVGYTLSGIMPVQTWWQVWIPVSATGVIGNFVIARRQPLLSAELARKRSVIGCIAFVFIAATYTVMHPRSPDAYLAFPVLIAAFCYAVAGVLRSPRYLIVGAALFALTLFGFFLLKPWLAFWLAGVGGGAMLLSGLWFRRPI